MPMTLEDFAHRCLMIKAGNATLDIPCCANCKYYHDSIDTEKIDYYVCEHPLQYAADSNACAAIKMQPEDFCSRWEERTC